MAPEKQSPLEAQHDANLPLTRLLLNPQNEWRRLGKKINNLARKKKRFLSFHPCANDRPTRVPSKQKPADKASPPSSMYALEVVGHKLLLILIHQLHRARPREAVNRLPQVRPGLCVHLERPGVWWCQQVGRAATGFGHEGIGASVGVKQGGGVSNTSCV